MGLNKSPIFYESLSWYGWIWFEFVEVYITLSKFILVRNLFIFIKIN